MDGAAGSGPADPFGASGLRERALAAWLAAPDRLREDANAEEELARGGYRDRVVVELAQNAADAAVRAGARGRLLLRLVRPADPSWPGVLLAANTGAPLDPAGARALATLRASAKRPEPGAVPDDLPDDLDRSGAGVPGVVGRFGVGFTAVLGVSDAPSVHTAAGGLGFDRARAAAWLRERAGDPRDGGELAAEVARRGASLPVLRTPFALAPRDVPAGDHVRALVEQGWATVVALPLRADAVTGVAALLDAVDDLLLLALPGLAEVVVEVGDATGGAGPRVVRDVDERWVVVRRSGTHAVDVLRDRPAEEQAARAWSLAWALPRGVVTAPDPFGGTTPQPGAAVAGLRAGLPGVVLAPTPTDEPLPWPVVLVASLPLEPTRRHVEPGPAADAVLAAAGEALADLLGLVAAERADGSTGRAGDGRAGGAPGDLPDPLDLVPVGPRAGWVEDALRRALLRRLPDVPLLRAAGEVPWLLTGARAVALEDSGVAPDAAALVALALAEPALVDAPRRSRAALEALGVRRVLLAELVDAWPLPVPGGQPGDLGGGDGGAGDDAVAGWAQACAALAPLALDQRSREALAGLPVPLADGTWVRGPRGVLLPLGGGPDGSDGGPDGDGTGGGMPPPVARLLSGQGLRLLDPRATSTDGALRGAGAAGATGAVTGLLERLGAVVAGPRALLDDPAVAAAVLAVSRALADDDLADDLLADLDPDGDLADGLDPDVGAEVTVDDVADLLAATVLGWLSAEVGPEASRDGDVAPVGVLAGSRAWLLDLPLRDDAGDLAPAGALVLPRSPAQGLLDVDEVAPVGDDVVDRWSPEVLVAAGVTASASVLRWGEVDLDDPPAELDDAAGRWLEEVVARVAGDGWTAGDVLLVRDLDLVAGGRGPDRLVGAVRSHGDTGDDGSLGAGVAAVLAAAASDPRLRHALGAPVLLTGPAGELRRVPGPTATVLADVLAGETGPAAGPGAPSALVALLPAAPAWARALPQDVQRAVGVVAGFADLAAPGWAAALDPDVGRGLSGAGASAGGPGAAGAAGPVDLLDTWGALVAALEDGALDLEPPDELLALGPEGLLRCRAEEVAVVDDPLWAARADLGPFVVVPAGAAARVADALDLDLATERAAGRVTSVGREREVPASVRAVLRLAGGRVDVVLVQHERLEVDGVPVEAWVEVDGAADGDRGDRPPGEARVRAHASTSRGAARALALAAGCWSARAAVADALTGTTTSSGSPSALSTSVAGAPPDSGVPPLVDVAVACVLPAR